MTGVQTCALPICFPVTIGAAKKNITYDMQDTAPQIFGISAYNKVGESSITTTDSGGALVKLGKPESPNGYTWSVK